MVLFGSLKLFGY